MIEELLALHLKRPTKGSIRCKDPHYTVVLFEVPTLDYRPYGGGPESPSQGRAMKIRINGGSE
jgi:hypothetical protein